jgi:hypothetical protein
MTKSLWSALESVQVFSEGNLVSPASALGLFRCCVKLQIASVTAAAADPTSNYQQTGK